MAESPLLKLRQELQLAVYSHNMHPAVADRIAGLLREGEERWELERQLHAEQVKSIRRRRHEYIVLLRTQVWLMAEEMSCPVHRFSPEQRRAVLEVVDP